MRADTAVAVRVAILLTTASVLYFFLSYLFRDSDNFADDGSSDDTDDDSSSSNANGVRSESLIGKNPKASACEKALDKLSIELNAKSDMSEFHKTFCRIKAKKRSIVVMISMLNDLLTGEQQTKLIKAYLGVIGSSSKIIALSQYSDLGGVRSVENVKLITAREGERLCKVDVDVILDDGGLFAQRMESLMKRAIRCLTPGGTYVLQPAHNPDDGFPNRHDTLIIVKADTGTMTLLKEKKKSSN